MIVLSLKQKRKLVASLIARGKGFRKDVKTEFIYASDEFLALMKSKWYSGRKSGDMGLRTNPETTGYLKRSWISDVIERGIDIIAAMYNNAHYGLYHELGAPTRNLKKRTDVGGDLEGQIGKQLFRDAVLRAIKRNF